MAAVGCAGASSSARAITRAPSLRAPLRQDATPAFTQASACPGAMPMALRAWPSAASKSSSASASAARFDQHCQLAARVNASA